MVRLGNCGSKAKESDQTDQKKRKKSSGRMASLAETPHKLYLTPCGGCSQGTLVYEGDKNTTKRKLKISLYNVTMTAMNF